MAPRRKQTSKSYGKAEEDSNVRLSVTIFGGLVAFALVALILVEVSNHQAGKATDAASPDNPQHAVASGGNTSNAVMQSNSTVSTEPSVASPETAAIQPNVPANTASPANAAGDTAPPAITNAPVAPSNNIGSGTTATGTNQ